MEEVHEAGISSGFCVKGFLDICLSLWSDKKNFNGVFFCSCKQVVDYLTWAENMGMQYNILVWHKTNPAPLCNFKYLGDLEYIVQIKGKGRKIKGEYKTKSLMYSSQVNKKDKKLYNHPTVKPVELLEKFLINHTDEGEVVLDPFMGSGSTGEACLNLKRGFIGIELSEIYYKTSRDRLGVNYAQ